MKVIIAGSRSINDYVIVLEAIAVAGYKITEVVSGAAQGVDYQGEIFARRNSIPLVKFPANWNQYGRSAGIMRNIDMGKYADALVAVWDGKSNGTIHMIDYMTELGKPVSVFSIKETNASK